MKIKKLYADHSNFKELIFLDGINVIIGGKSQDLSNSFQQHNVGKTLCLEIIDFCLFSDFNKEKKIYHLQQELIEYTFFLMIEIEINDYITLSRSVKYPGVIKFKNHTKEEKFENTNAFHERTIKDIQSIFSDKFSRILHFDVDFRKILKRFIRYSDQYIDPLNIEANKDYKKKDIDWIPGLMNTLAFNYDKIYTFFDSRDKIARYKVKIKHFKKAFDINCKKTVLQKQIDQLNSQIVTKSNVLDRKQEEIKNFNFETVDKDIINKSLLEINEKLQPLNEEKFYLLQRIKNLNESLKINFDYNIDKNLYYFFQEVNLVFKEEIKRSFDDLIKFNEQLLKERKIIAKEQLKKMTEQLLLLEERLKELNVQRREKLNVLNNTDIQEKYFLANRELDQLKPEIFNLEKDKEKYEKILTIVEQEEKEQKNFDASLSYYNTIKEKNELFTNLGTEFNYELEKAISTKIDILFSDKKPVIEIVDNNKKPIKEGSTFTKIISIYFDMILAHSYFEKEGNNICPVIHDNIFTDMQDELKSKTIELMKKYLKDKSIQYIFTDFKDSIPDAIFNMINKKEVNLVTELYRTENDYTETLFRKNLKITE